MVNKEWFSHGEQLLEFNRNQRAGMSLLCILLWLLFKGTGRTRWTFSVNHRISSYWTSKLKEEKTAFISIIAMKKSKVI